MLDNQKINASEIAQIGGVGIGAEENASTEPSQQFLVFKIDNEEYALDMSFDFRIGGDVFNQPWQYMMDAGNIKDAVGACCC